MGVNEFLDDSPISFDVSTTLEKNATTLFLLQKSRNHATDVKKWHLCPILGEGTQFDKRGSYTKLLHQS